MFQELMPLLAQRILLLTLSRVSDEQISVNVIPRSLKSDQRDHDAALTTPLSITGTPKELDEQLSRQLVEFVGTHLELSSTLNNAKEQMAAAAKAASDAARKSTSAKAHSGSNRSATPSRAQVQEATETNERADEARSESETCQAPAVGSVGPGTGTGNLFEPKNDQ